MANRSLWPLVCWGSHLNPGAKTQSRRIRRGKSKGLAMHSQASNKSSSLLVPPMADSSRFRHEQVSQLFGVTEAELLFSRLAVLLDLFNSLGGAAGFLRMVSLHGAAGSITHSQLLEAEFFLLGVILAAFTAVGVDKVTVSRSFHKGFRAWTFRSFMQTASPGLKGSVFVVRRTGYCSWLYDEWGQSWEDPLHALS